MEIFYFVEIHSISEWTWIHLNLKAIEISDQTQKINRYSKSTIETLEEDVICSKLTITQWSDDLLLLGYR